MGDPVTEGTPNEENICEAIRGLVRRSYAPYSRYFVAAAVVDEFGNVHYGVNVENVSFPLGSCAEQNAIGRMVTDGGTKIHRLYVTTAQGEDTRSCGGCLQRIAEFAARDCEIVVVGKTEILSRNKLEMLLPAVFTFRV